MEKNSTIGKMTDEKIEKLKNLSSVHKTDNEIIKRSGYVIFLDVLGWKQKNGPNAIRILASETNNMRNLIYDVALRSVEKADEMNSNATVTVLSDTIAIMIDGEYPYCSLNIFNTVNEFVLDLLKRGIAVRGAISYGNFWTNKTSNIFMGEAINDAAYYCESADWAGVILTDNGLRGIQQYSDWKKYINNFNLYEYERIPFKSEVKPTAAKYVLIPVDNWITITGKRSFDFKKAYEEIMDGNEDKIKIKLENTLELISFSALKTMGKIID